MFCDVDSKKISKGCYTFENAPVYLSVTDKFFHAIGHLLALQGFPKPRIPIVHFKCATPPFAICVKWVRCFNPSPNVISLLVNLVHAGFDTWGI